MKHRNTFKKLLLIATIAVVGVALFGLSPTAPVSAQEPIVLDENKLGNIDATNPQPSYIFTAQGPQSVQIEVLGIAQGMAPQFTVLNQSGALVQAVGNPALQGTVSGVIDLAQAGAYTIQVQSANGVQGQFVLTVSNAAPAVPPTPLPENVPTPGALAGGENLVYSFPANPTQLLVLDLGGTNATQSVTGELRDAEGNVIAVLGPQLLASSLTLPPGTTSYLLELNNPMPPESLPINYTVLLTPVAPDGAAPIATEAGTELPALPVTGACVLATQGNNPVNVRSGPDGNASVVTQISQFATYAVTGRNADSSWYQINYGSGTGWVSAGVTRRGGDCAALQDVSGGSGGGPAPQPTEDPGGGGPAPQPTEEATQPPDGGGQPPQPTEEATQPPNGGGDDGGQGQAQIAGDNETSTEINIKNGTVSHSGNISYPDGDTQDTVFYRVVGFDQATFSGDVNYTVTCSGPGAENARVSLNATASGGSPCPRTGSQFHTDDSDQGWITIYLEGGEGAYVTWTVVLSANN